MSRDSAITPEHIVKERAFMAVEKASEELELAKRIYTSSLLAAREAGCSNAGIARRIGKTEVAVRRYIARKLEAGSD